MNRLPLENSITFRMYLPVYLIVRERIFNHFFERGHARLHLQQSARRSVFIPLAIACFLMSKTDAPCRINSLISSLIGMTS